MPPRAATSPIARRCSTRSPRTASSASRALLERAVVEAGGDFDARLHALAQAFIAFATRHPALLELMFAGKQRPGADRLRAAADRAYAPALAVIAEAQAGGELAAGDPGRVAILMLATLQGLAAMATDGLIASAPVGDVVTGAIDQLLDGLRPRADQASGERAGGGSGS